MALKLLGALLLSLPFVIASAGMIATGGWMLFIGVWSAVLAMVGCMVGGLALIELSKS